MFKTKRPSFVTLWVVWNNVKMTCTTYIAMKKRSTTTMTSHNFKFSLTTPWSCAHYLVEQFDCWSISNIFLLWWIV
jgi:hypothetical protein